MGSRRVGLGVFAIAALLAAIACKKRDDAPPPVPGPPGPVLTAVAPITGTNAGGVTLTLTGTNFVTGATVTVGGVAAVVGSVAPTQIVVTTASVVPVVGPLAVTVTNPDSQFSTLAAAFTAVGPAPTLALLAPTAGPAAGGTTLHLNGTNFAPGATVTVGGAAAAVSVVTPGTVIATTPAGTAGLVTVVVTNLDGQAASLTNAFRYWGAGPTLTAVSVTSGPNTGGTALTLTGTGFVAGTIPHFGGAPATSIVITSATQITCTTPALNPYGPYMLGPVNVDVVNPDGQGAVLVNAFNATGAAPTVTAVNPTSGSSGGGTRVTLTGTNFKIIEDGSTGIASVTFGGVAATAVDARTSTQIRCCAPAGSGTVTVLVANPDGQVTATGVSFTFVAGPGVTAIAPATGPLAGGTTVTITGTGFAAGDTVTVGGGAATSVTIASATQITCVTPSGVPGTTDVTVTSSGGVPSTLPTAFTYATSVNAQTAVFAWDTAAGIDCRRRFYLDLNKPSLLKDLQNRGLQSFGTPGDTSAPPAGPALVDQYALDWARAYVLRTINIVYGRNANGTRISGQSINITFTGLPPASGQPGCATPATDYTWVCFGGCHPGSGAGHPIASQTSCGSGVLGRAHFDNSDGLACNSYAEVTCNSYYHGCAGCSIHNGIFTSNIGDTWNVALPGGQLAALDQQYLDGTTNSGTRYTQIHTHLQQWARRVAFVAAHEIGHIVGLSANGASGPCAINIATGQCGATPGHNNCCTTNLMYQSISLSSAITFTDYTKGLSGNPDPLNPSAGSGCSTTGQSSWAVLQAYLGVSP